MSNSGDRCKRMIHDEERHTDYLEAQLHAIGEIGIDNYLATQMDEDNAGS